MVSESILLVDDEADLRNTLAEGLRQDGYLVVTAASAKEAIAKVEDSHFPIVITDLMMPGGPTGLDLISAIKTRDSKTLCIVMTGFASIDSAIEAIKYGAYDFLRKPFGLNELEAAIDRSLNYIILQEQLASYQQELERRVVTRIAELKEFHAESVHLAELLGKGLHESELHLAVRELFDYLERRFKPKSYAIILHDGNGNLKYFNLSGKETWPDPADLKKSSSTDFKSTYNNNIESYLYPLGNCDSPIGWVYLEFDQCSFFQADDPVFDLWRQNVSIIFDILNPGINL